jgi:glycosyltransferase involved in cell wall biosynthesis
MKCELIKEFGVDTSAVTVIPFGINNSVPITTLTRAEARERLGIEPKAKVILFFGSLRPYKGLDTLVSSFQNIASQDHDYTLVIAGEPRKECEEYLARILTQIESHSSRKQIITRFQYVPDCETELYFKTADLVALPYVQIFQSGVLFLAFSFGVPVVASDIGSFREDVIEGRNGFLYHPTDPDGLAAAIQRYFKSKLYMEIDKHRNDIRDRAQESHSWELIGRMTRGVYEKLLR